MIAFWNRKTVYVGYSLDHMKKAMNVLQDNNIRYATKYGKSGESLQVPISNVPRNVFPSPMLSSVAETQPKKCILFVHKDDFEKANSLLHNYKFESQL